MKQTNKNSKLLIIAMCIVIAVLVAVVLILVLGDDNPVVDTPDDTANLDSSGKLIKNGGVALDGNYVGMTAEEIIAEMQKNQTMVRTKVSSQCVLQDGIIYTMIDNAEENNTLWQATYKIEGEEEVLGVSAPIYPGQHIEEVEAKYIPPNGEYRVEIIIDFFEPDSEIYLTQKIFIASLTVQ